MNISLRIRQDTTAGKMITNSRNRSMFIRGAIERVTNDVRCHWAMLKSNYPLKIIELWMRNLTPEYSPWLIGKDDYKISQKIRSIENFRKMLGMDFDDFVKFMEEDTDEKK